MIKKLIVISLILLACTKKQNESRTYDCPCKNAYYCAYMLEFREYLYARGLVSNPDKTYYELYSAMKSDTILISLSEVWDRSFDYRSNFDADYFSVKECYDSLLSIEPEERSSSWTLIDIEMRMALNELEVVDESTVRKVSDRAFEDSADEFAMLHFILAEAMVK